MADRGITILDPWQRRGSLTHLAASQRCSRASLMIQTTCDIRNVVGAYLLAAVVAVSVDAVATAVAAVVVVR